MKESLNLNLYNYQWTALVRLKNGLTETIWWTAWPMSKRHISEVVWVASDYPKACIRNKIEVFPELVDSGCDDDCFYHCTMAGQVFPECLKQKRGEIS